MKPVIVSTTVARPASEVYEHLLELPNHEAFLDHFLVDWSFSGPRAGVGARARARTDAPGGQDWTEFELVEAEPGRIVEDGVGAGGKRHTRGTYRLEARGEERTEVSFELEWIEASRLERFGGALTRAFIRRSNNKAMRRLAKQLGRA